MTERNERGVAYLRTRFEVGCSRHDQLSRTTTRVSDSDSRPLLTLDDRNERGGAHHSLRDYGSRLKVKIEITGEGIPGTRGIVT